MRNNYRILLLNLAISCLFFVFGMSIASHVHAQMPGLPYQIYGKVTTDSGLAVKNAKVEAVMVGSVVATSVTNADGVYGIAPHLMIISNPDGDFAGKPVSFSVNGVTTSESSAFESGSLQNVDLIASSSVSTASKTPASSTSGNGEMLSSSPVPSVLVDKTMNSSENSSDSVEQTMSTTLKDVSYITPVFHIKKHSSYTAYTKRPSLNYAHSYILGVASGTLVLILLIWVFLQNYLHKRKIGRPDLHL